jgi:N-acetylglucosaminyldiphosphoundecaprenol N-acetyl-beta-D-mannosaminyltransferase
MVRDEPAEMGKGRALRWAMDRVMAAERPDAIVVVDADSVADPRMLSEVERELAKGHRVVQADYSILAEPGSQRSAIVEAGFLLFHRVRFTGRARLGMSANLVGNGMLFSTDVLEAHPWDAFTGVEDLEYSIRLRLAGIATRFAPAAHVMGPGSASAAGALKQRLRWEGGRFHVARGWLWTLVRESARRRDAGLLGAALDLATPPLGLLCMLAFGGAVVSAAAVVTHLAPSWAALPWVVALVTIPLFVVIGLEAAGAPGTVWRLVLKAPFFLLWKVGAYASLLRGFDVSRWDRTDRAAELELSAEHRVDIAGVPVDAIDMERAIARVRAAIGGPRLFQVSTVNLDFVVRAQSDAHTRGIFSRTDLNLPDGAPVVWLGRLLGARMPGRVAGADIVPALLSEAAKTGLTVFLLGGENGVAATAATRLQTQLPGLVVVGTYEPARAAVEDMNNAEILARISEARPDLLLVAFGNPKQERWIDLHRDQIQASVAIGVGCVLDIIAGRSRRAPRWMRSAGLEWAYRLGQEPRRLFGRYMKDAAWLLPLTARALRIRLVGT